MSLEPAVPCGENRVSDLPDLVFVAGYRRCFGSSLACLVNGHPEVLVLDDSRQAVEASAGAAARDVLRRVPPSSGGAALAEDRETRYRALAANLVSRGRRLRWFGDTVSVDAMDDAQLDALGAHALLYVVRDVRSWLLEQATLGKVFEDENVAPLAIRYVCAFLRTFAFPRCVRIRTELLSSDPAAAAAEVGAFLSLELPRRGNAPARVGFEPAPQLTDHPLWRGLLPIFEKYYFAPRQAHDAAEIAADCASLANLAAHPAGVDELYDHPDTGFAAPLPAEPPPARSASRVWTIPWQLMRVAEERLVEVERLAAEVGRLRTACDERLRTIEELHAEANRLRWTCDKRMEVVRALEATCAERLLLIEELHAEAQRRQNIIDDLEKRRWPLR